MSDARKNDKGARSSTLSRRAIRSAPLVVTLICVAWVAVTLFRREDAGLRAAGFNVAEFGRIPVLDRGRVKPIDTVARSTLLRLQGRQSVRSPDDNKNVAPVTWLLDTCFDARASQGYRVFEITQPEVLALAHLTTDEGDGGKRFSYRQLQPHLAEIERQARIASAVGNEERDSFQRAILALHGNLVEYQHLKYSFVLPESPDFLDDLLRLQDEIGRGGLDARAEAAARGRFQVMSDYSSLHAAPPMMDDRATAPPKWRKTGEALLSGLRSGEIPAAPLAFAGMGHAWRNRQPGQFNEIVHLYMRTVGKRLPADARKARFESGFNSAQPFYTSTLLYFAAFMAGIVSWLKWPDMLRRCSFNIMAVAWALATAGIIARMWLEGRPPVTNLYSSALGAGWCAVTLCLVLEYIYRNSLACVAGSFAGFCTLIIAHNLSLSGDTMEVMRAVLDSNFWLATHVVTITLGYGGAFLAGGLGIIYILRGVFTRSLDAETAAALGRMVHGVVCFSLFFSFVGTVLGGIWADQSWGRFWGWDPKENGALLIVIWNAVILHARRGGTAGRRALMQMAVFGNVVTSFSWFGTNMLGMGLHSYGFMEAAFYALWMFVMSQLAVIATGFVPEDKWRSGTEVARASVKSAAQGGPPERS